MPAKPLVSPQTRNNWSIASLLFVSGVLVFFSSFFFLLFPGGYEGGRNPAYRAELLSMSHATWDILHTWAGVTMIAAAALHIPLHWAWIVTMAKRVVNISLGRCERMNAKGQWNLMIDAVLALAALLTALSGLYFLFTPGGQGQAGLLWSRPVWDTLHTWAGVVMAAASVLHFAIHWRWVTQVTGKMWRTLLPQT